ncbi:MAG TPA: hypothetical protein VK610_07375, partial [Rhodothermales bacterium]|nr:hypothetical protein [Rhodothermales bacterium]
YPVAVAPRDGGPAAAQARALLGVGALVRRSFAEAPLDPLTGPAAGAIPAGVRPWLAAVVPLLRHRLRLALGPEESVADVLRRPGRLYLTSSHVDLVQSVGAITLAVRRSGLDRDPGWLPAFGRVVYFHFDGPAHALR